MPSRIRRHALCVGVLNGVCQMVYEFDLNAVELRAEFDGARAGKWYRFDMEKGGGRNWELVDDRLPTRQAKRVDMTTGKHRDVMQICLPIFFVPDFTTFGWKRKHPRKTSDKIGPVFYSPGLESSGGKCNVSAEKLAELGINEGEQCSAFLSLNIETPEGSIRPPQWKLQCAEDFEKINTDPLRDDAYYKRLGLSTPNCVSTANAATSKEWGVVLQIQQNDPNNSEARISTILSLRNGKLAFGRILRLKDSYWKAQIGDTVGFSSIEVDCFVQPLRMAFNVLAWETLPINYSEISDQFPQEPVPELPSLWLVHDSDGRESQYMFELDFLLDDQMLNPKMGTHRIERLGNLLDLDGKLSSALSSGGQQKNIGWLVRVRARFCLVPEQQWPLWVLVEVVGMWEKSDCMERRQRNQQKRAESAELMKMGGERSRANPDRLNGSSNREAAGSGRGSSMSASISNPSPTSSTTAEGGFGSVFATKWEQKSKQQYQQQQPNKLPATGSNTIPLGHDNQRPNKLPATGSNTIPLGTALDRMNKAFSTTKIGGSNSTTQSATTIVSKNENAEQNFMEGVVLFTRSKGDELYWLFYDEQSASLTRPCCSKRIKIPFPEGHPEPLPGDWFHIVYKNQRTPNTIAIMSIRAANKGRLPTQKINPHNLEVWTKVLDGKHEEINFGETEEMRVFTPPLQQQLEQFSRPKTPQQQQASRRNAPVPVTNVFSKAGAFQQSMTKADENGITQSSTLYKEKNSAIPLFQCKAKFFHIGIHMAGIVVSMDRSPSSARYSYQVWPFCTGRTIPRELTLESTHRLQIGHWLKFAMGDYNSKVITEENCQGLAPWMATQMRVMGVVCMECDISVPTDFGANPNAELCTVVHKPGDPNTPFIRKLVPRELFLPQLTTGRFQGSTCQVLIEYEAEQDEELQARGFWRIVEMKAN